MNVQCSMSKGRNPASNRPLRRWSFEIGQSLVIGHWSFVIFLWFFAGAPRLSAAPLKAAAPDDPTLQTDANWFDDRWQKTEIGPFHCAAIETPRQKTYKGVAIKVGDNAEGTA